MMRPAEQIWWNSCVNIRKGLRVCKCVQKHEKKVERGEIGMSMYYVIPANSIMMYCIMSVFPSHDSTHFQRFFWNHSAREDPVAFAKARLKADSHRVPGICFDCLVLVREISNDNDAVIVPCHCLQSVIHFFH